MRGDLSAALHSDLTLEEKEIIQSSTVAALTRGQDFAALLLGCRWDSSAFAWQLSSINKSRGSQEMTLLILERASMAIIIFCSLSFYPTLCSLVAHASVTTARLRIFKLQRVARDPTRSFLFYGAAAGLELCAGTRALRPTWVAPSSALMVVLLIYGSLGCKQS